MNANAYGGELARVLEWVDVCTAAGAGATPARTSSASPTGARPCARGGRLARRRSGSTRPSRRRSRRPWRRCAASAARRSRRGSRPSARPSRTRTTPGRRGGPPVSCSRPPAAGACRSAAPGSRPSMRTSSRTPARRRTADILALMAEGRRRVHERFGVVLEPEVQVLGEVEWPADWDLEPATDGQEDRARRANHSSMSRSGPPPLPRSAAPAPRARSASPPVRATSGRPTRPPSERRRPRALRAARSHDGRRPSAPGQGLAGTARRPRRHAPPRAPSATRHGRSTGAPQSAPRRCAPARAPRVGRRPVSWRYRLAAIGIVVAALAAGTSSGFATRRWSRSTNVEVVGVASGDRDADRRRADRGGARA